MIVCKSPATEFLPSCVVNNNISNKILFYVHRRISIKVEKIFQNVKDSVIGFIILHESNW